MPFCPKCGNRIEEDEEYCARCGQRLRRVQGIPREEQAVVTSKPPIGPIGASLPRETKSHRMAAVAVGIIIIIGISVGAIVLWKSSATDLTVKVENYGMPVYGATVRVVSYSGYMSQGVTSYDGSVTFQGMPNGVCAVTVVGWGYFDINLRGFSLTVIADTGYDHWYYA